MPQRVFAVLVLALRESGKAVVSGGGGLENKACLHGIQSVLRHLLARSDHFWQSWLGRVVKDAVVLVVRIECGVEVVFCDNTGFGDVLDKAIFMQCMFRDF